MIPVCIEDKDILSASITSSRLVVDKPCLLYSLSSSYNIPPPALIKLRDGFTINSPTIFNIIISKTTGFVQLNFPFPIVFKQGLYVEGAAAIRRTNITYKLLSN